jgi:dihydroxyacid dehydratase/phosphogluconate dehydratase
MGAASAGKPAIMLTAGPRSCGQFQGRPVVTSDVWTLGPDRIMGRIDDEEWDELEGVFAPTVGVCNVMGTATTMAIATEVLGMALPGSAVVPAVESRRSDLAERTGVRAVELARAGTRPEEVMTQSAFDNALCVLAATGGSTNEFIHLEAIAGRLGVSLGLDRFAGIGEKTPQVLGVRPSGDFSLEDFDHAGGVPALLAVLEPLLDRDSVLGDGRTVAEVSAAVRSAKPRPNPCLRSLEDPFEPESGLVVLRGSLAPRGAVFKRSAAPRALWTHRGPAVVFDYHTAQARPRTPTSRPHRTVSSCCAMPGPSGHPACRRSISFPPGGPSQGEHHGAGVRDRRTYERDRRRGHCVARHPGGGGRWSHRTRP